MTFAVTTTFVPAGSAKSGVAGRCTVSANEPVVGTMSPWSALRTWPRSASAWPGNDHPTTKLPTRTPSQYVVDAAWQKFLPVTVIVPPCCTLTDGLTVITGVPHVGAGACDEAG